MKNQSSENYLDQLLNSISNGAGENRPKRQRRERAQENSFERELFGEAESEEAMTARDEEDFLREFEAELLTDDIPYFDKSLLEEADQAKNKRQSGMDATDASIDDMLKHMDSYDSMPIVGNMEAAEVDENAEFDGSVEGGEMFLSEEAKVQAKTAEKLDAAMEAFKGSLTDSSDLALTEDGEADLSGMGGSDLMDLLSGADGMSDLGDMLSADSSGIGLSGVDEIGSFAQGEMEAQQRDSSPEEEGGKKRRKKKRADGKGGFLSRIIGMLFGDEEPQENLAVQELPQETMASQLSQENLQILKELEATDGEARADGDSKKKKKDKKKDKSKAAKPKKEAKPKKPPKPKKEKPPKEKDNTPPLPKGSVRAIVIMVASLFGLVMLGTNLLGYQSSIREAKSLAMGGSYADAYATLSGLQIKEKDMQFYNQLTVLAPTSAEYNTYLIFSSSGRDEMALDALVCAYGRYDLNKESARKYECMAELEILGSKVIKSLLEDYNMTGQEALEMYRSRTRKQYTLLLYEKCESLGLE